MTDDLDFKEHDFDDAKALIAFANFKYFQAIIKNNENNTFDVCFLNTATKEMLFLNEVLTKEQISKYSTEDSSNRVLINISEEYTDEILNYLKKYEREVDDYLQALRDNQDRIIDFPKTLH